MRPFTQKPLSTSRASSPGTAGGDVQTITPPDGTSACLITVETTNARATFDGTDPSAANAPSHVVIKDQNPLYVPIGQGATIKFCSTAAAAAVMQVTFLQ